MERPLVARSSWKEALAPYAQPRLSRSLVDIATSVALVYSRQYLLDLKLSKAGDNYQAKMTQLVVGFDYPVDGALLGNKIYVLDYGGKGSIWEVTLP